MRVRPSIAGPGDMPTAVDQVLERLLRHRISNMAFTGSVAIRRWIGAGSPYRTIQDVDLVVASIDDLPSSLSQAFLCSHVHPDAPRGRLVVQFADAESAIRIDVFRARGAALERARPARIGEHHTKLLSLEDITANTARLLTNLGRGESVAPKHAKDFAILRPRVDPAAMAAVWLDYRRDSDEQSFELVACRIDRLLESHPERLIDPPFETDPSKVCQHCRAIRTFIPAPKQSVLEVLGFV